jgi:hypothetical protein
MAMTGTPKDVVGHLVDDSLPAAPPSFFDQMVEAVKNLIFHSNKELITWLRAPTPIKITRVFTVSANGTLGGSVAIPDLSQIIYTSPMGSESWLHRITITSPDHGPATPILAPAQLALVSSNGPIILMLPEIASTYQVAPTQFIEGRLSAPHLSAGESLTVSGDGLPNNAHLRFDLQIVLTQGVSEFTPKTSSPTDLTLKGSGGTTGLG